MTRHDGVEQGGELPVPPELEHDQQAVKILSDSRGILDLLAEYGSLRKERTLLEERRKGTLIGRQFEGILTAFDINPNLWSKIMHYEEHEEPNPIFGSLKTWHARSFPYNEILEPENEPYAATFEIDLGARFADRGVDNWPDMAGFISFGVHKTDTNDVFAERQVIIFQNGKVDLRDVIRFSAEQQLIQLPDEATYDQKAHILSDLNELKNRALGSYEKFLNDNFPQEPKGEE